MRTSGLLPAGGVMEQPTLVHAAVLKTWVSGHSGLVHLVHNINTYWCGGYTAPSCWPWNCLNCYVWCVDKAAATGTMASSPLQVACTVPEYSGMGDVCMC